MEIGNRGNRDRGTMSQINVTPFVDVMLVLLIIFMVTAPMITSGIKVDLPQANNHPIESKDMPAMVTIGKDGNIYLQYEDYKDSEPLTLEQLETVLAKAQQQAEQDNKQLTVLVNGEKSRPYGEVVSLMASLQEAGLTQVGLLTEPLK